METQDSIRTTTVWESENDIIVPVTKEEVVHENSKPAKSVHKEQQVHKPAVHAQHGVPKFLAFPYVDAAETPSDAAAAGVLPTDSLATDSVSVDSVAVVPGESLGGILLVDPAAKYTKPHPAPRHFAWGGGLSWIYLALTVLFCAVAFKFKGSAKYMKALYKDLVDTRVRPNVFDETVRETSLLVLLNMLWVVCAGVLLWALIRTSIPYIPSYSLSISDKPGPGIGICIAVMAAYTAILLIAYWVVGTVFSDRSETRLWLKGAVSANGLETFILFPCALLTLTCPFWSIPLLIAAGCVFLFGKFVFLYKGFRIFFNEISSWLLFLYYLCSLEIVPLILTYVVAVAICSSWL